MTTGEEKICLEKPGQKQAEEHENKHVMIFFAILLGLTVLIGGLLDFFFAGVPLHFTIPIINVRATVKHDFVLCVCSLCFHVHWYNGF